jgi:hypothetical protein
MHQQRDNGLRHVRENHVEDIEIATVPKITTKILITIVHWHWIAIFASHLAGRAATLS